MFSISLPFNPYISLENKYTRSLLVSLMLLSVYLFILLLFIIYDLFHRPYKHNFLEVKYTNLYF